MSLTSMHASDAEREAAIRELTQHCGDGRLTLDELEERVAEAYAATTRDELRHALRELPATPRTLIVPPPERANPPSPAVRTHSPMKSTTADIDKRRAGEVALKAHLYTYLSVIGFLVAIWFLTSPFGYFWPIWPAVAWGVGLSVHAGVEKAKS